MVQIGPYVVEVTCYNMHHRGKDYVGTSFPAAAPGMTPTHAATKIQAHMRGREVWRMVLYQSWYPNVGTS